MDDSIDNTNDLENYGVWVKHSAKDENDLTDSLDSLDLPDFPDTDTFDDTDFSDMFKDDSQFTSEKKIEDFDTQEIETPEIEIPTDISEQSLEASDFADFKDNFETNDNEISLDSFTAEQPTETEEVSFDSFEDVSFDSDGEEEISLDDFMDEGFSDVSVAAGNNGFEPGKNPAEMNNQGSEEVSLDDFFDADGFDFGMETAPKKEEEIFMEEKPLEMEISFDDSADSVETEDNTEVDTDSLDDMDDEYEISQSLSEELTEPVITDSSVNKAQFGDTEEIDLSEREPMNIVFLIDVSGSMYSDNKLPLVQKSFSLLTESLTPQDRVSIVTYAGSDRVVLEGADGNNKEEILEAINSLEAGGSTAGADGINTAYRIAEKYFISGGNNRIVLATDGDLNVGISSESELTKLVEKKRETGVFLSVLGFGTGNIKDNKMEALADNGNGNYSYIDSVLEAKKVLVEEMGGTLFTVAKDVKLQLEFNPAYIKGYRLIGYENRMLAAEDFEDDTKDAGEIGAGHSVTAIYEVVTVDSPMELNTSDLKYSETVGEENGEMLTVSIRYKEPDGDTSKLLEYPVAESAYNKEMSENLAFASSVAQFGLVLRESEYKGTATYDSILDSLESYDFSKDSYKAEFITLVEEMKNRD